MRRTKLSRPDEEGLAIIDDCPYVHVAWVDDGGHARLRAVHGVRVGDAVVFHGGKTGEKAGLIGRSVVVQAEETVASIPSYFTDPERACPATTFYRSVQIEGRAELMTDGEEKARALDALMRQFQAEGGCRPIRFDDPEYAKSVRGVAVVRVGAERIQAKANLGQYKPLAVRQTIIDALWRRGDPKDPETIERMRAASDVDPAPAWLTGAACRLHVWAPPEDAGRVAPHLRDAYWNAGLDVPALTRAHQRSDAWVVGRDDRSEIVATARAVSDDTKHAWIYDVWVAPSHRRRGVATALLELLLDHPRVRTARLAHLCTKDAQPLYRKLGFEEGAVSRHPYMRRERG